jgi:hypothetical protein
MDKIKIKGLVQGRKKLEDGSFAIGFRTKWGVAWFTMKLWPRFKEQNKHLAKLFNEANGIDEDTLIGRYLYVTNKAHRRQIDGEYFSVSPII